MPSPKLNTVIRRPDLGGAIIEMFDNSLDAGFIGRTLLPSFRTNENAGVYPVIPKEALMKNVNPARAPKSAYIRTNYEYERGTYMTYEYGVEEVIDDVERELMDQEMPGGADMLAARRAAGFLMRAQERRIASLLFNETNFTLANGGLVNLTDDWNTPASSTPIKDIKEQLNAFRLKAGTLPDALVMNWEVYNNLTQSKELYDQILYTFPGLQIKQATEAQIAQALGVPRLIVAGGLQDTAGFGLTANITDIWSSNYAMLIKIGGMDLRSGGVGRIFEWTRDAAGMVVEQYREEAVRGDVYRVRHYVGEQLLKSVDTSGVTVSSVYADNATLLKFA